MTSCGLTCTGLADFKAAVKRSVSNKISRSDSTSSGTKPSYLRMASSMSQHSITKEDSVFGLSNLSHFSIEDLPIASAPSPHPGRRTFPGGDEGVLSDEEEDQNFQVCIVTHCGRG